MGAGIGGENRQRRALFGSLAEQGLLGISRVLPATLQQSCSGGMGIRTGRIRKVKKMYPQLFFCLRLRKTCPVA